MAWGTKNKKPCVKTVPLPLGSHSDGAGGRRSASWWSPEVRNAGQTAAKRADIVCLPAGAELPPKVTASIHQFCIDQLPENVHAPGASHRDFAINHPAEQIYILKKNKTRQIC